MRRRDFITLVGAVGTFPLAVPLAARAQNEPVRPLIGLLSPLPAAAAERNFAPFRSALRDLGYVDGRNMTLALRYGEGAADRMAALARELIALKPDVIVAGALSGALAAYAATRTIPIVVITPEDPVVSGFAKSIAKPGGNVTGTWPVGDDALVGKRLDFLKLAVPGLTRVAVLFNPEYPGDSVYIAKLPAAASALGLSAQLIEVRDPRKLDATAAEIARAGVQGLYVLQSPPFHAARIEVTSMVARLKLPTMYGWRDFADAGGLMSYGPNLPDIYRQSARLVGRILKGEKPGDLPFELPTRYELIVNLKTAKAMGLTLPNSFVLLADEVIE
jgi:putative ABC transport system substrate-binding protein